MVKKKRYFSIDIDAFRNDPVSYIYNNILYTDQLSEDVLREFHSYFNWVWISSTQKLSKEFIVEFYDKIDFEYLMVNDNISNEIKTFCKMFI